MKLSKAQQNELVVWKYFIPKTVKWDAENEEDIKKFFEWSEQGKHKERNPYGDTSYFEALRQGKRWAGIHMEMYEEGVLEGSTPYITLLGGFENIKRWWQFWKSEHKPILVQVKDFLKKEMFKGHDAEIIERCYQSIL